MVLGIIIHLNTIWQKKGSEVIIHAKTWMNLENIMLS